MLLASECSEAVQLFSCSAVLLLTRKYWGKLLFATKGWDQLEETGEYHQPLDSNCIVVWE
jgi:hypothetical protein